MTHDLLFVYTVCGILLAAIAIIIVWDNAK